MVTDAAVNPWSQQQQPKICPGIHLLLNYWSREPRAAQLATSFFQLLVRKRPEEGSARGSLGKSRRLVPPPFCFF